MPNLKINNLDFAKKAQEISSVIRLSELERLAEAVYAHSDPHAEIHYQLQGIPKIMQHSGLHLKIAAKLPVLCQRCLEPMPLEMVLDFQYVISTIEPPELADSDEIEWLEPSKEMDLIELIEDELLMALPIAPTHRIACAPSSVEAGDKANPFSVLKGHFK